MISNVRVVMISNARLVYRRAAYWWRLILAGYGRHYSPLPGGLILDECSLGQDAAVTARGCRVAALLATGKATGQILVKAWVVVDGWASMVRIEGQE